MTSLGGVNLKTKRMIVEQWHFLNRCKEERVLLEKEMTAMVTYIEAEMETVHATLANIEKHIADGRG